MDYSTDTITELYTSNDYVKKNPSMHIEDSQWKVEKLRPFIDRFLEVCPDREINLLDVGGGAGVIVGELAKHMEGKDRRVRKYLLDLCPEMLEIQKVNNRDYACALNEDIRHSSLGDQEITITLMIDTIEHIPDPVSAMKELSRISRYVLYKVPLENCAINNVRNFATRGEHKKRLIDRVGHINLYSTRSFRSDVAMSGGEIVVWGYANVFEYQSGKEIRKTNAFTSDVANQMASVLYRLSPRLSTVIFTDHLLALIKCRREATG